MRTRCLLMVLLSLMGCKSTNINPTKPVSMPIALLPKFDLQGHRGCRGLMPENTVGAMLEALRLGVTTLELDVVISKEGIPVLSHEPFFNHEISVKPDGSAVTEAEEKSLNLYQMTVKEIQSFDVGTKLHPRFTDQLKIASVKPTLAEVFSYVKEYMMTAKRPFPYFNIETKSSPETDDVYHPQPAIFVNKIMEVVRNFQQEEQVTIQSFDTRTLQYLHQHFPEQKTALLVEQTSQGTFASHLKNLGFTPTVFSPEYILVTPELVAYCHAKNIAVIPWTVNDRETYLRLKKMGIDGIITDYPNRLHE